MCLAKKTSCMKIFKRHTADNRNLYGLESEFGKPEISAAGLEILKSLMQSNIPIHIVIIFYSEAVKSHLMSL